MSAEIAKGSPADIAELLRQGLDDYGRGDVDAAVRSWRAVLAIDPSNSDALDYIEASGRQEPDAPDAQPAMDIDPMICEAMQLATMGDVEGAFELLSAAAGGSLEHGAAMDLLRAHLIERYRIDLDRDGIPAVVAAPSAIQDYNLPPDAGFLLSLVDGMTPVGDLVSLSGMDPFTAFRMLRGLADAHIVELRS